MKEFGKGNGRKVKQRCGTQASEVREVVEQRLPSHAGGISTEQTASLLSVSTCRFLAQPRWQFAFLLLRDQDGAGESMEDNQAHAGLAC